MLSLQLIGSLASTVNTISAVTSGFKKATTINDVATNVGNSVKMIQELQKYVPSRPSIVNPQQSANNTSSQSQSAQIPSNFNMNGIININKTIANYTAQIVKNLSSIIIRIETSNKYLKSLYDINNKASKDTTDLLKDRSRKIYQLSDSRMGQYFFKTFGHEMVKNYERFMYRFGSSLEKNMISTSEIFAYKLFGENKFFKNFFKKTENILDFYHWKTVPFTEETRTTINTQIPERLEGILLLGKDTVKILSEISVNINRILETVTSIGIKTLQWSNEIDTRIINFANAFYNYGNKNLNAISNIEMYIKKISKMNEDAFNKLIKQAENINYYLKALNFITQECCKIHSNLLDCIRKNTFSLADTFKTFADKCLQLLKEISINTNKKNHTSNVDVSLGNGAAVPNVNTFFGRFNQTHQQIRVNNPHIQRNDRRIRIHDHHFDVQDTIDKMNDNISKHITSFAKKYEKYAENSNNIASRCLRSIKDHDKSTLRFSNILLTMLQGPLKLLHTILRLYIRFKFLSGFLSPAFRIIKKNETVQKTAGKFGINLENVGSSIAQIFHLKQFRDIILTGFKNTFKIGLNYTLLALKNISNNEYFQILKESIYEGLKNVIDALSDALQWYLIGRYSTRFIMWICRRFANGIRSAYTSAFNRITQGMTEEERRNIGPIRLALRATWLVVRRGIRSIGTSAGNAFTQLSGAASNLIHGNFLASGGHLVRFVGSVFGALTKAAGMAMGGAMIFGIIMQGIRRLLTYIVKIDDGKIKTKGLAGAITDLMINFVKGIFKKIMYTLGLLFNSFGGQNMSKGIQDGLWSSFKYIFAGLIFLISKGIGGIVSSIVSGIGSLVGYVSSGASNWLKSFSNNISDNVSVFGKSVSSLCGVEKEYNEMLGWYTEGSKADDEALLKFAKETAGNAGTAAQSTEDTEKLKKDAENQNLENIDKNIEKIEGHTEKTERHTASIRELAQPKNLPFMLGTGLQKIASMYARMVDGNGAPDAILAHTNRWLASKRPSSTLMASKVKYGMNAANAGKSLGEIVYDYNHQPQTTPTPKIEPMEDVGDPITIETSPSDRLKLFKKSIMNSEGFHNKAYRDSKGHWTIGVGHRIRPNETDKYLNSSLSNDEVLNLFEKDFNSHYGAIQNKSWFTNSNPITQLVLGDMAFNMGTGFISKFPKFKSAIERQDLDSATEQLLNSKYTLDVKDRAYRNAAALKYGIFETRSNDGKKLWTSKGNTISKPGSDKYDFKKGSELSTSSYPIPSNDEILKWLKPATNSVSQNSILGLKPELTSRLVAFAKEVGQPLPITSGYRSNEEQEILYKKKGPKYAAKPGHSRHNFGLAVDISSDFMNKNADKLAKFGLVRPLSSEPWHVQISENAGKSRSILSRLTGGLLGNNGQTGEAESDPFTSFFETLIQLLTGNFGQYDEIIDGVNQSVDVANNVNGVNDWRDAGNANNPTSNNDVKKAAKKAINKKYLSLLDKYDVDPKSKLYNYTGNIMTVRQYLTSVGKLKEYENDPEKIKKAHDTIVKIALSDDRYPSLYRRNVFVANLLSKYNAKRGDDPFKAFNDYSLAWYAVDAKRENDKIIKSRPTYGSDDSLNQILPYVYKNPLIHSGAPVAINPNGTINYNYSENDYAYDIQQYKNNRKVKRSVAGASDLYAQKHTLRKGNRDAYVVARVGKHEKSDFSIISELGKVLTTNNNTPLVENSPIFKSTSNTSRKGNRNLIISDAKKNIGDATFELFKEETRQKKSVIENLVNSIKTNVNQIKEATFKHSSLKPYADILAGIDTDTEINKSNNTADTMKNNNKIATDLLTNATKPIEHAANALNDITEKVLKPVLMSIGQPVSVNNISNISSRPISNTNISQSNSNANSNDSNFNMMQDLGLAAFMI